MCRQYGISHSHFLGGPLRWTEDDQDKSVAYERYLATACGHCGTHLEDWEEDRFAFIGHQWRCPGCEVLAQERENVDDDEKGVQVGLVPRRVSEAMDEAERLAEKDRKTDDPDDT